MSKEIHIDEIDKQIIYYYRNDFRVKTIVELMEVDLRIVRNRIARLRNHGMLKRWWEEEVRDS